MIIITIIIMVILMIIVKGRVTVLRCPWVLSSDFLILLGLLSLLLLALAGRRGGLEAASGAADSHTASLPYSDRFEPNFPWEPPRAFEEFAPRTRHWHGVESRNSLDGSTARRRTFESLHTQRLAEYGWKPHRAFCQQTYHGPQSTGICVNTRRVRFHRIRDFKQYHSNSIPPTSHTHPMDIAWPQPCP